MNWKDYNNTHSPYALVIAPTRELAMQITTVFKEVCNNFKQQFRIEIVSIVGGMSEQKQRRQLVGTGKPLHIVVATPGRLCDIFQDESVEAFQNMSGLKYLVVDEADRIMEEGHFAEVMLIIILYIVFYLYSYLYSYIEYLVEFAIMRRLFLKEMILLKWQKELS